MMEGKLRAFLLLLLIHFCYGEDPEVNYNALQLIKSKGYPGEEHFVTTEDGYILGLQRIPHGKTSSTSDKPRPVIFLQHGLLCSSTNWLTGLEDESFAYILADAGFDVWLGNIRGNTYSRNHTSLSPKDKKFWKYSFDQHAKIDLPAMVDYALKISKQDKLYYVGHSQGTIMGFAGFSINKTLASQIHEFYALAPVAYVGNCEGAFKYLAKVYKPLEFLLGLSTGEFIPDGTILDTLASKFCVSEIKEVCGDVIFLICGFDEKNLNETRLPVYLSHTPSSTSLQNVVHWSQMVNSGKFQMYDYESTEENQKHYNQDTPPLYNLTELTVPTYLFTGGQDWLADPTDVAKLIPQIKHVLKNRTDLSYYEHLDFIWGVDANKKVYDVIIDDIKRQL